MSKWTDFCSRKENSNFIVCGAVTSKMLLLQCMFFLALSRADAACDAAAAQTAASCMSALSVPTSAAEGCNYVADYLACYPDDCCTSAVESALSAYESAPFSCSVQCGSGSGTGTESGSGTVPTCDAAAVQTAASCMSALSVLQARMEHATTWPTTWLATPAAAAHQQSKVRSQRMKVLPSAVQMCNVEPPLPQPDRHNVCNQSQCQQARLKCADTSLATRIAWVDFMVQASTFCLQSLLNICTGAADRLVMRVGTLSWHTGRGSLLLDALLELFRKVSINFGKLTVLTAFTSPTIPSRKCASTWKMSQRPFPVSVCQEILRSLWFAMPKPFTAAVWLSMTMIASL